MNSARKTILIVDDEPMLRELLEFEMVDFGFDVCCAQNGREALELVKVRPVNAVISDIRMPGGDGVELLEAIKAHNIDTPVVLLMSGFTDLTIDDAYDRGAVAMFSKPIDLDALKTMLSEALLPRSLRWSEPAAVPMLETKVELTFDGNQTLSHGQVVRLGRGGMFVQMEDLRLAALNDGVRFKLIFKDHHLPPVEGAGLVRWVRTSEQGRLLRGAGIEFKYLSDQCRQQVAAVIDQSGAASYIPRT